MNLAFFSYLITSTIPTMLFLYAIQTINNGKNHKKTKFSCKQYLFDTNKEAWKFFQICFGRLMLVTATIMMIFSAYTMAFVDRIDTIGNVFVMINNILITMVLTTTSWAITNNKNIKFQSEFNLLI